MKKKISFLVLLCVAALSFSLLSGCSTSGNPYDYKPDDYTHIEFLDVTVDASAGDRSVRITEKYIFTFEIDNQGNGAHGFYRDMPLNSGEKIRDLKVYDAKDFYNEYEISHESSDILRVKVGSANRLVPIGKRLHCTIEYTMITPEHSQYKNALVINAIGQGWNCDIKKTNVSVKLPAETNETPMYRYGEWGSDRDPVEYGVIEESPVSGKKEYSFSVGYLAPYEGLTLYYFMPEGAFSESYSESTVWFVLLGGLALVGLALLFKFTVGKSLPLAPVVNYYPPKHVGAGEKELPMDPVDMGYLIDNNCQGSDVTSLIFYFASCGYLEIIQPENTDSSEAFTLKKICDMPEGLPKYQYTFFNRLFKKGDEVTVSQLTNKTYTAVQSVQTQIKTKYSGKLYDTVPKVAMGFMAVLTVAYAVLITLLTGFKLSSDYINLFGIAAIAPVVIAILGMSWVAYNRYKLGPAKSNTMTVIMALAVIISSLLLILFTDRDLIDLPSAIIMTISVMASSIVFPFIMRRSKYYTEELNEVLGFKDFLQTAEKDRLEMLLEENPQYYYDILPYANVLGVSDKWEDKFKGLTLEPPTYYRGVSVFDVIVFNRLYRHSYRAYSTAAVSHPRASSSSSRSGGGFSGGRGGGFSGGGFGGGGGGRW